MPNKKRFESLNLTVPFTIQLLDMYEITDIYARHITLVYDYIVENKEVSIEVPNEDKVYKVFQISRDEFFVGEYAGNSEDEVLGPIELVNWLFAKAPFISMVGYSTAKK